ncbi:MAG TPA: SIMPL domain-containing protein [Gemmatimonadaceae bacterium]|nr:SIMPL domain-containing protein [Gemmatimonadaceae bacterium]
MMRAMGVAALAASMMAVGSIRAQGASDVGAGATVAKIVVSGHGEATVTPDRASIVFAVETRAATADEASARNAELQQAVIQAIKGRGVAASDITTVGYQLHPEMSYEGGKEPRVIGYVARNSVQVLVRQIGETGRVIDAAIRAGSNRVNSLSYESSKAAETRRLALAKAVESARADAEAIARAAGGTLGSLVEVVSSGGGQPSPMPRMLAMTAGRAEADTPIEVGEQTMSADVVVTWRFVPGRE